MSSADASPLMRQYREIKRGYPDAILFFRVGDFYEMFYEDAQEASKILSITLTSRDKHSAAPVPLCGVPYHAATGYIAKLLAAGHTVALCEQVEDPKNAKGLVQREVVRLYTPGTLIDTELLSPGESNFLAAVAESKTGSRGARFGLAALDVSTGTFWVTELTGDRSSDPVLDEIARLEPRELLYAAAEGMERPAWLQSVKGTRICAQPAAWFEVANAARLLEQQFHVASVDGLGCAGLTVAIQAAGAVLRYFKETHPNASLNHVRRPHIGWDADAMHLDSVTVRNLELIKPMGMESGGASRGSATLLGVLDRTSSAMGSRLLREWLLRPLVHLDAITARLDAVAEFRERLQERVAVRAALRSVQDIARLGTRIALGAATPRDIRGLAQSLAALPELKKQLAGFSAKLVTDRLRAWDDAEDLRDAIDAALLPDVPHSSREGNLIRDGYDARVDELRKASRDGKSWIAELEAKERERTGIESLKIRYNQVFGYYIEVTKANVSRIPADYIRKQTLANAERYMTSALKGLEERVTGAETRLIALEYELFELLRSRLAQNMERLHAMADTLATLDVLSALAEAAALHRYERPSVDEGGCIAIREGRHPVVEQLDGGQPFIPNDTILDLGQNRLLILTGPNMAGKSTYLRQIALIVLMAQVGSFVPASEARIGLVDRVFTRVGASDNLARGQSTFMVEMIETAHILNSATRRSLILLDEIGRGTSTYDGLSLAWAIAEYIQDRACLGARTLFATHYHEMTQLEQSREGIRNYRVDVREQKGTVTFLRKIVAGGADRSYGIHVAQLAGLPSAVIQRAQEVLAQLERGDAEMRATRDDVQEPLYDRSLPPPHPLVDELRQLDLFAMTPLEALNRIADWQRRLREDQL